MSSMLSEIKPYTAFASTVSLFFRNKFDTSVFLSPDKQKYVIRISNFPIHHRTTGNVYLVIPRDTFIFSYDSIRFQKLEQAQIRIYQGTLGQTFIHPHIFIDSKPCLNKQGIDSASTLFIWFIQTLMYGNVSQDTLTKGRPANNFFGEDIPQILKNVNGHRSYLKQILGDILEQHVGTIGKFFRDIFGRFI